jgi:hypothetical protein
MLCSSGARTTRRTSSTVQTQRSGSSHATLLCSLGLILGCGLPAWLGQTQSQAPDRPLAVHAEGGLEKSWAVRAAGLQQRPIADATDAYVDLQNNTDRPISEAAFYGEYFDAAGRFCYSMAFSQSANFGDRGPVLPRDVRRFEALGLGLFPASTPQRLNLYAVRFDASSPASTGADADMPIRVPVNIIGSVGADAAKLNLPGAVALSKESFAELLLASLSVDARGEVTSIDVVNNAPEDVREWFLRLAKDELTFYPASRAGQFELGEALVLVRAVLNEEGTETIPAPSAVPAVQSYISRLKEPEIPPISQILVGRSSPPEGNAAGASAELLELRAWNTDWSSVFRWTFDPSQPRHMRRLSTE